MVVNAVFKNQNWLYVQTPHAEEGYVGYACCLPLGILPTGKTTPCKQQRQPPLSQPVRRLSNVSYITNGHNGQHLHPKSIPQQQQQQLSVLRRQQQNGLRQTLVAINADYITESIVVHKGEIVTLCECRESKDQRQWFYVKTRDGREGFIPAEVAGHGYL
ncbi:uncharacterized protein LOC115482994 [Drosophila hydei]|uniref:Uncharacterized protein LOC115482994 n=1 Tax=Drosophila hydei TaxID=7224 RepID=A0A6J2STL8_DROHY|nr:uncharacterized protein LOC115482994 [Drosophila hydei]XP_030079495.1 uncharacterized protein LOC115482994 [Drosophila hydei]